MNGGHLIVSFKSPEAFDTLGGKVTARKIVVGLNHQQVATSLHTIDENGRLIGHSKWSGVIGLEIVKVVKTLPNKSLERTRDR
jgi:hypothetical protein